MLELFFFFFKLLIIALIFTELKSQSEVFPINALPLIQYVASLSNLMAGESAVLKVAAFQLLSDDLELALINRRPIFCRLDQKTTIDIHNAIDNQIV